MQHAKKVIALLLTLIAVAGLAACGSDDDETTGATTTAEAPVNGNGSGEDGKQATGGDELPPTKTIVVRDGEPVGGIAELEYDAGEQIYFRVRSNKADEVHIHGYDVTRNVGPGIATLFSFLADIEGIFEVELHGSEKQIAELRINP